MGGLKDELSARGLLLRTPLPPEIDALLTALQPDQPVPAGADVRGSVSGGIEEKPLGVLALDLRPPGPSVKYHLVSDTAAGTFSLWLLLSEVEPAKTVFGFAGGLVGGALTPATLRTEGERSWLDAADGEVTLAGAGVALLIDGAPGSPARMRLTSGDGQPPGLIHLELQPPTVLLAGTGIGLELADGLWIDESDSAAPPGATTIGGQVQAVPSDAPAWRGLAARTARLFLPPGVPLFDGHPVEAYVEVGSAPAGIDLAVRSRFSPDPGSTDWEFDLVLECRDPTAQGLQDLIPTLVEATMTLPLPGEAPEEDGFTVMAGAPVRARLRLVREGGGPETRLTLALESQGEDGLLTVSAPEGGTGARTVVAAGALATALVADQPPADADASGAGLHAILVVALGLSAFLKNNGRLTLHGVELESAGHGLPVGEPITLKLDYSVDVIVQPVTVGVLAVSMDDAQPMGVRNRNVRLTIDPRREGLDMLRFDFGAADMELTRPGGWQVKSPASLFDVVGTRSGRGSMWMEVDLHFALDLGPVKVSGATIRITHDGAGGLSGSLRGLEASLAVPGVISGRGALRVLESGFEAALDVRVVPMNLAAAARVIYAEGPGGEHMVLVWLGVDLPAPIPIANTGLGLFGVAGAFGVDARPQVQAAPGGDPIGAQLAWSSAAPGAFGISDGSLTFGAEAVIGTLPDLGFSFSAKGGVFLTVPDIAIRGALWGTVMSPRMGIADRPDPDTLGVSFTGAVVVDAADGVTVGLKGRLTVPVLVDGTIPLGAHFPFSGSPVPPDDWFVYLGADGYNNTVRPDGRGLGPVQITVLPDLMPTTATAYLMLRGRGIDRWPRGDKGAIDVAEGFIVAFGFGYSTTLGIEPIVWADIHASLDVLLATRPLMVAGFGNVGGSLHLGPFSIGVDADVTVLAVANADPYILARICGRIDLFFTDIEGCVEISVGPSEPAQTVPVPDIHPLDDVEQGVVAGAAAYLIDDRFRRVGVLHRDTPPPQSECVWPDTLLHLAFGTSPTLGTGLGGQFSGVDHYPSGVAAQPIGSAMLRYEWQLNGVRLVEVTDADPNGAGVPVSGPLSAAWQAGRDGDMGTRPQAGDLVLLTHQGDLWVDRLADAGEGLASNPIREAGRICLPSPPAQPGWAVGWGAAAVGGGAMRMPADRLSPDPTVSRFTADVTFGVRWLRGVVLGSGPLPPGVSWTPPTVRALDYDHLGLRSFSGELDLGVVGGVYAKEPLSATAQIVPSAPLAEAQLVLVASGNRELPAPVVESPGEQWDVEAVDTLPDGRIVWLARCGGEVTRITVSWSGGASLSILGLSGITPHARAAATARADARAADAARQAAAAAAAPQQPATTSGEAARCILEPGRLYRLDVDMTWSGWLSTQKEGGLPEPGPSAIGRTEYLPIGGGSAPTSRSFFFRTAPKPPAKLVDITTAAGATGPFTWIHFSRAQFDPRMLERHIAGYTPAQSEQNRFCDDPLQVHFSVAHAAALAAKYGYDLKLGLRRVDVAGPAGEEQTPPSAWVAMAKPLLLGVADRLRHDVALTSPCPTPPPGASLQATVPLVPRAWYEIFTLAAANEAGRDDGRIAGTTFRTSRWRTPGQMLEEMGFAATAAPGSPTGDVALTASPPTDVVLDDDAALDATLDALGLDGWPTAAEPRISVLWSAEGAGWRCAGVLVESPEPIHRPGRLDLVGLDAPGGTMPLRRRDRTGSRLLFTPDTPLAPASGDTIALRLTDHLAGGVISGRMALPAVPAFAGDP